MLVGAVIQECLDVKPDSGESVCIWLNILQSVHEIYFSSNSLDKAAITEVGLPLYIQMYMHYLLIYKVGLL